MIFVDDSPNGPAERIREINRCGRQVCCLQPMGRLASPPPASKGLGQRPPVHRRYGYPPCSTRRCCGRCWRSWRAGRFDLGCILDGKGRRSSFQDPPPQHEKPLAIDNAGFGDARKPARGPRRDRWVGRSRAKMSAVGAGPSRIREASRWITQREVGATVQPTSTHGREPAHRRAGAPAGDRDLETARRTGDERPARTLAALRGAVCHAGAGSGGGARRTGAGGVGAPHWPGSGV